jgi:hypothetical protein
MVIAPVEAGASRTRLRRGITAAAFLFAVAGLVGQALTFNYAFAISQFDEWAHIDYSIRLADGELPAWGDRLDQRTISITHCIGAHWTPAGDCSEVLRDPAQEPALGYSYQAQQAPVGYIVAATVWKLLSLDTQPPDRQVEILRAANVIVATVIAGLLALLMGSLARTYGAALAGTALVIVAPTLTASMAYVNNDLPAVAAGLVVILVGVYAARTPRDTWPTLWVPLVLAVLSGVLLGLIKATAIGVPFAFLVYWVLARHSPRARRRLGLGVAALQLGGALTAALTFALWQGARAVEQSTVVMAALQGTSKVEGLPLQAVVSGLRAGVGAFLGWAPGEPPMRDVAWPVLVIAAIGAAAVLGGMFVGRLGPDAAFPFNAWWLGIAIAVAVAVSAVGWVAYGYLWDGYGIPLPFRYLTPMIPLAAVVALPLFEKLGRWAWAYAWGAVIGAVVLSGSLGQLAFNARFLLGVA